MSTKSQLPSLWERGEFEPFISLHREIDRVFDNFAEVMPWGRRTENGGTGRLTPQLDLSETEKSVEVIVELPGVEEDAIDVTVTDDVLSIRGEKKAEKETEEKDYHMIERSYGAFHRSLTLPCEVEADKVEASFNNGILQITMPKSPEAESKAHKVKINSSA